MFTYFLYYYYSVLEVGRNAVPSDLLSEIAGAFE